MEDKVLKRSEVPEELTWRLEDIYADDSALEADISESVKIADELAGFEGKLGESGETKADQTPAVPGEDATEMEVAPTLTEAELAVAKAEAEQKMSARRELLEENIRALVADRDALLADFDAMVTAYNREKINELTVTVTEYNYWTPSLLSGAFIKKAIQTAGPIVALGFIACMALIVISRRKEEKRAFKA